MPPLFALPLFAIGGYVVTVGLVLKGLLVVGLLAHQRSQQRKAKREIEKRLRGTTATSDAAARLVMVRSSVEPRRTIYGEPPPVAGLLSYIEATGASKEYLWLVITLAGHQVQEIGDIWIDDERIPAAAFNGSGDVTTGRYAGYVRVKKYLGTTTDAADADLVAASASLWTTDHRQRGCAKIYVRLLRSDTVFPNGLPNIRAQVKGALCYDPRDGATGYTENPALHARDYLTSTRGLRAGSGEIDDATFIAAANVCEERVAVSSYTSPAISLNATTDEFTFATGDNRIGTGDGVQVQVSGGSLAGTNLATVTTYYAIRTGALTGKLADSYAGAIAGTARDITGAGTGTITLAHIDQARYTCNGSFTAESAPRQILEDILATMASAPVWTAGKHQVFAGAYVSPTVTLTADDLRGAPTYVPRPPRSALFNTVRAVYPDPFLYGQPTDAPPVSVASFVAADDNEAISQDRQFGMVTNVLRAQRLAKAAIMRGRPGVLSLPCKLTAVRVATMDTVQVTLSAFGFTNKVFRVTGWALVGDENGVGVDLSLEEEASTDWSWSAGEASIPPVQPPIVVPGNLDIVAPTGLTMASGTSELLLASDGTLISRIKVSWTAPAEPNLAGYELRFKRTAESTYNVVQLPSDGVVYYISPVRDGDEYNVGIRTRASGTARSAWTSGTHTVIGKTEAPAAPTSLAAAGIVEAVRLTWTNAADPDIAFTEVWEHTSDDRASATKVGEAQTTVFTRTGLSVGASRYYWVRHVDRSGNLGAWNATAGVSATTATADGVWDIYEDFISGGLTSGSIGLYGWSYGYAAGAPTLARGAPSTEQQGALSITLNAVNDTCRFHITSSPTDDVIWKGGLAKLRVRVAFGMGSLSINNRYKIGICDDVSANVTANRNWGTGTGGAVWLEIVITGSGTSTIYLCQQSASVATNVTVANLTGDSGGTIQTHTLELINDVDNNLTAYLNGVQGGGSLTNVISPTTNYNYMNIGWAMHRASGTGTAGLSLDYLAIALRP